jgi:deoxyribonuclease-1-like protein
MAKLVLVVLVIAVLVGGSYFFLNFEIQRVQPSGWKIVPRQAGPTPEPGATGGNPARAPFQPTLRIASFDLGRFDDFKLANPQTNDVLVQLLPKFDLVAIQGVRGRTQGVLVRLIEQINAKTGRTFDFATSPAQQRDAIEHYSAFIFDTARVDVDRTTVQFVDDQLGRFRVKPLIGLFRAHGPDPAEAFTFMLINVEVDPDRTAVELDLLADAYRAVRDSHPKEDDVILLGDLESDDQHLGRLGKLLGVTPLISGIPTTARGTLPLDNILLDRRATVEFMGRAEVGDMMREYHLSLPAVTEISDHLPIWAEFSVYEGGQSGRVLPNAK